MTNDEPGWMASDRSQNWILPDQNLQSIEKSTENMHWILNSFQFSNGNFIIQKQTFDRKVLTSIE